MNDEPDPLEAAFRAFDEGDVDVDDVLSEGKALADDGIARLQASARAGSSAGRQRAAEKLASHFSECESAAVLDRVVGCALDDAGMHGEALETRRHALETAPAWHPGIASDLLAAIARGFVLLENAEGSVPWIERAFSFDPFHVSALRTLVDALVATDDAAHAFGVADHLARFGVAAPASLHDRPRPSNVPPFAPDLGRLRALDDRAFGKLVASIAFDARPRPQRALRVHALACAMRGAFAYASMCGHAALGAPTDSNADSDEIVAAKGLALATAARAKEAKDDARFSVDPTTRRNALHLDDLDDLGDREALRVALHDPSPAIRLFAAEHVDDPLATAILRAQAELERARTLDLRPMHELHGAAAAMRAKAMRARPAVRVLPVEGADHPMFDRLREREAILLWSIHDAPVDAHLATKLDADLRALPKRDGGSVATKVQGEVVEILHRGSVAPRPFVEAAIAVLTHRGARTIVAGRFTRDDEANAWHFVDDGSTKQVWYERLNEDGWDAAFDPRSHSKFGSLRARKPPISDPREGWSAQLPAGDGHVPELRPLRLVVPDLRVVWGLPDVEHRGAPPIRTPMTLQAILARAKAASRHTPRGESMARALAAAIATHVDGPPLQIVDHRGNANALDEIVNGDRRGFAFGVQGVSGAFVQHVPGAFWFREYEMILALRDAIRSESLAPVVHWFRRDGLWVFNLWERG